MLIKHTPQDGEDVIVMFQSGMTAKHFTLTGDIFVHLELCFMNTADLISSVKHWKNCLGVWVKVRKGTVLDLTHSKIGNSIFLKAGHVTMYLGFQELLKATSLMCIPHLQNNLHGAQEYVHNTKLLKLMHSTFSNNALPKMPPQPPSVSVKLCPLITHYAITSYY